MKMLDVYPLQFIPHYEQRLWGGEKFKTLLHKDTRGNQLGESWEIAVLKDKASIIRNGAHEGKSLPQLVAEDPVAILGQSVVKKYGANFPLLIKFIDAKLPLSVQVHPNDQLANRRHQSFGKTEMWYILDAEPEAELVLGLNRSVSSSEYQRLLADGQIETILHKEQVKAGDVIHVPAGLVHGIGKGILLAEIQQSSNITYRVYDYERIEAETGRPRELHHELAAEALDFSLQNQSKVTYTPQTNQKNRLIESPFFITALIELDGQKEMDMETNHSFVVLMGVEGNCSLIHQQTSYTVAKGAILLLPASLGNYQLQGKGKLLEVHL